MTLAVTVTPNVLVRAPQRVSSLGRRVSFPSRPSFAPRASSDDDTQISTGKSSLEALDRLLSSTDDTKTASTSKAARPDPFADPTAEELRLASSSKASVSSESSTFEAKRGTDRRTISLFEISARFEGAKALATAMTKGDVFSQQLTELTVGNLAVVGEDYPSLSLWKNQHYEVRRMYFQRADDELGSKRIEAKTLGDEYPENNNQSDWTLYVELFSEEYHATTVRVKPGVVGLRTVGSEIIEALFIAVPVSLFWASLGYSFIVSTGG